MDSHHFYFNLGGDSETNYAGGIGTMWYILLIILHKLLHPELLNQKFEYVSANAKEKCIQRMRFSFKNACNIIKNIDIPYVIKFVKKVYDVEIDNQSIKTVITNIMEYMEKQECSQNTQADQSDAAALNSLENPCRMYMVSKYGEYYPLFRYYLTTELSNIKEKYQLQFGILAQVFQMKFSTGRILTFSKYPNDKRPQKGKFNPFSWFLSYEVPLPALKESIHEVYPQTNVLTWKCFKALMEIGIDPDLYPVYYVWNINGVIKAFKATIMITDDHENPIIKLIFKDKIVHDLVFTEKFYHEDKERCQNYVKNLTNVGDWHVKMPNSQYRHECHLQNLQDSLLEDHIEKVRAMEPLQQVWSQKPPAHSRLVVYQRSSHTKKRKRETETGTGSDTGAVAGTGASTEAREPENSLSQPCQICYMNNTTYRALSGISGPICEVCQKLTPEKQLEARKIALELKLINVLTG